MYRIGHLTNICTHTLKSTVVHCRHRGSHVFVCIIDYILKVSKVYTIGNYF